jgi:hypothetical protein
MASATWEKNDVQQCHGRISYTAVFYTMHDKAKKTLNRLKKIDPLKY